MTDREAGRPRAPREGTGASAPAGSTPRWVTVGLPALALVVAFGVAGVVLADGSPVPGVPTGGVPSMSAPAPPSELEGEWVGKATPTRCAGFDDEACSGTRSITLTVECSGNRCAVTPFAPRYGSPPLQFVDGVHRASGPVPADAAPTCGGAPTSSALWRLELVVRDGRLGGSYQESTVQGFDCGATGVEWQVLFDRE
ncbi:hypothetical protein [Blastococcus brunescens]|uniref:Uncharacterized protein n=1 Tax=Blastococcus brunescens TaxID=1564165 RepID=A0ABZ1B7U6_9ACTN|nr:hypothetical protein [Blastococcus sp. BMG 8361]WRL65883.1 hypothetical protein U6N30_10190 [Blastococcus sp. BMG 8361]